MGKSVLLIVLAVVICFSITSCSKLEEQGEIELKSYPLSSDITSIVVSTGFELFFDESLDSTQYTVAAYSNIHSYIKRELSGEELKVFVDKSNREDDLYLKLSLSPDLFSKVRAEEASTISSNSIFRKGLLSLELAGGSYFNGTVECDTLQLHSQGGAIINIAGNCSLLEISSCSGGSIIDGEYLHAEKVSINLSGGSRVSLSVVDSLVGSCSGGSIINYKSGVSTLVEVETSGGSSVDKL